MNKNMRCLLLELLLVQERYSSVEISDALKLLKTVEGAAELREIFYILHRVSGAERRKVPRDLGIRTSRSPEKGSTLDAREQSILEDLNARVSGLSLRSIVDAAKDLGMQAPNRVSRKSLLTHMAKELSKGSGSDIGQKLDQIFGPPRQKDTGFADLAREIMKPSPKTDKSE